MNTRSLLRCGTAPVVLIVGAALVAASHPTHASTGNPAADVDCTFVLRARNDMGQSVYVDLYDSWVLQFTLFSRWRQLQIQNQRIAPGSSMDRRYTASGACSNHRKWILWTRRGSDTVCVRIDTEGTSSTSRTVDLGPATKWGTGSIWGTGVSVPCVVPR